MLFSLLVSTSLSMLREDLTLTQLTVYDGMNWVLRVQNLSQTFLNSPKVLDGSSKFSSHDFLAQHLAHLTCLPGLSHSSAWEKIIYLATGQWRSPLH